MQPYKHSQNMLFRCINCGQGQELVVDFWGCDLNCLFCYAWQYSHTTALQNNQRKKKLAEPEGVILVLTEQLLRLGNELAWIRFTGGEPILNRERVKDLIVILKGLNEHIKKPLYIVIQTNGTRLKHLLDPLSRIGDFSKLRVLLEISIKGTNSVEFELLSGCDGNSKKIFSNIVEGYWAFDDFQRENENVSMCLRLGIFHDVQTHNKLTFVYPDWKERLPKGDETVVMFHPENWDEKFEEVYYKEIDRTNKRKYVEPYMAAEYLKLKGLFPRPRMVKYFIPIARLRGADLLLDREGTFTHDTYRWACKEEFGRFLPFPSLTEGEKKVLKKGIKTVKQRFSKDATETFHKTKEFP